MAWTRYIANTLTFSRIIGTPLWNYFFLNGWFTSEQAICIFGVLASTDFFDGVAARRFGSTPIGPMLDPFGDKWMYVTGMPAFIALLGDESKHPLWLFSVVASTDFMITILRSVGAVEKTFYYAKLATVWVQFATFLLLWENSLVKWVLVFAHAVSFEGQVRAGEGHELLVLVNALVSLSLCIIGSVWYSIWFAIAFYNSAAFALYMYSCKNWNRERVAYLVVAVAVCVGYASLPLVTQSNVYTFFYVCYGVKLIF